MSLATKTLKKQKGSAFVYILQGVMLAGVGIYGGIMILKNGIGVAPSRDNGPAAWLYRFLSTQMEKGETAEKLVPICFAGFFFILGAIGCFHLARGIWKMGSGRTVLGKSILHQAESHEGFGDVLASIDADMSLEPAAFGNVSVGRKWILDTEAMRLSNIRGIFWMDAGMEDYVLCCVDEKENIWAGSLRYRDQRDKALAYLRKILPDAATGDKEAYVAYLRKEFSSVQQAAEEPAAAPVKKIPVLSRDTKFIFVRTTGIPTSNFTYEDVMEAYHMLEVSKSIALQPLNAGGSAVTRILVSRISDSSREIGIFCKEDDGEYGFKKSVEDHEAESFLDDLLKDSRLPDVSDWSPLI